MQANCFEGVVSQGDMVYYPGQWWHATQNIGANIGAADAEVPSLSLSSLIVDRGNFRDVREAFEYDCSDVTDSKFHGLLCSRLPRCFGLWEGQFGTGTPAAASERPP